MLSGVTVSCFVLSYLVVMAMETAKVFLKLPGKNMLLIGMLIAGIFAHSVFLINSFLDPDSVKLLANWFQWSVMAAWCLAVAYLVLILRNPSNASGLFLIPLILALIGLGMILREQTDFSSARSVWTMVHGSSLLLGTMFICFGLSFGIMYLLQSARLKSKGKKRRSRLKLPPLEFLQSMNRLSLITTTIALGFGMLSGIALNQQKQEQFNWLDTGVLFTLALFLWSLVAMAFELAAKGSLGGRRSAYLVISNFVFMVLVLSIVVLTSHGHKDGSEGATTPQAIPNSQPPGFTDAHDLTLAHSAFRRQNS